MDVTCSYDAHGIASSHSATSEPGPPCKIFKRLSPGLQLQVLVFDIVERLCNESSHARCEFSSIRRRLQAEGLTMDSNSVDQALRSLHEAGIVGTVPIRKHRYFRILNDGHTLQ